MSVLCVTWPVRLVAMRKHTRVPGVPKSPTTTLTQLKGLMSPRPISSTRRLSPLNPGRMNEFDLCEAVEGAAKKLSDVVYHQVTTAVAAHSPLHLSVMNTCQTPTSILELFGM